MTVISFSGNSRKSENEIKIEKYRIELQANTLLELAIVLRESDSVEAWSKVFSLLSENTSVKSINISGPRSSDQLPAAGISYTVSPQSKKTHSKIITLLCDSLAKRDPENFELDSFKLQELNLIDEIESEQAISTLLEKVAIETISFSGVSLSEKGCEKLLNSLKCQKNLKHLNLNLNLDRDSIAIPFLAEKLPNLVKSYVRQNSKLASCVVPDALKESKQTEIDDILDHNKKFPLCFFVAPNTVFHFIKASESNSTITTSFNSH